MTNSNPPNKTKISRLLRVLVTAILLTALAFIFFLGTFDEPRGGPVIETSGVIQSSTVFKSSGVVAIVRLEDNNLVKANVVSGEAVQQGEIARIRMYRSIITGRRTYDVYQTGQPISKRKTD